MCFLCCPVAFSNFVLKEIVHFVKSLKPLVAYNNMLVRGFVNANGCFRDMTVVKGSGLHTQLSVLVEKREI